jgi:hypothetical protein
MQKKYTKSEERELSISKAIKAISDGTVPSLRSAAFIYSVPLSTLHNRLKGTKPHSVAHENTQILTAEEEKALENYIVQLDEWGHPLKISHVRQFVQFLLISRCDETGYRKFLIGTQI